MIARKSFLIVTSQFFTRFLGWIGLVVIAKLWGGFAPEALGILGFAMAFLAMFNIVADLGFSQAHVKRVSEGNDLGTCIGTYAAIKLILTSLMVTIVFVAVYIWKNFFNGGFTDATTESVIAVFVIYYIFLNLAQIATVTFQGRREIAKRQVTGIFENIVKIPLEILVALAGVSIVGVTYISPAFNWPDFLQPLQQFLASHAVGSLAMTYAFATMTTFFVGMWLLRKYPLKKPSWDLCKSYFSFALPIMLISIIGVISVNIDKIMIGYFWTSREVGYYFTTQNILEIVVVLSGAVGIVLFPTISKYHSSKNFHKIMKTTHLAERYVSMVIIPVMVVIIVFVNPVIYIMLSDAFLPAASVFVALTIYTFIINLTMPYHSLIGGINRPGITAKIGFIMCSANIALNYLLIPEWGFLSPFGIKGPTGAAIATGLSALIGFVGLRLAAKKLTGIKLIQNHTPRHIIAGLVMGIVLYFLAFCTPFFPYIHWYDLLMFAGMGLAVYLGILFVLKEFNKQDLDFFLDMIHPKEMIGYIKSELKGK
ncbi:membrane protein involved in the export of O-antigen and teichoic acid [Thermoplasmatales archaeon SCGC AB-539-N05]|nr:membrane protein involved in the export of O-antigen and teichoic acid [Thermoplasmatales archaeon SCGC AB-539-N05]ENO12272.1 membrane protein involved in the export of O-antigen and teichoic acid [Thermoplasmatales archaeon SCGC AB-539-C06]